MGKVKVSNGQETFEIDGSDLQSAVKDGFKPTERIVVANSKTNESYEIDPNDIESALNEGFSFSDIVKKNAPSEPSGPTSSSPQKDLLTLSKERKEINSRIGALNSLSSSSSFGGAPSTSSSGEEYKSQLASINDEIKKQGGDDALADDLADLPTGEGFSFAQSVPNLMKMRQDNKYAYNRELSAIKSKGQLFNAVRDKTDLKTASQIINGLQETERKNYKTSTKEAIDLVHKYVDDEDEQQKIIKDLANNKAYEYGIQPMQSDERFASMNPYQQRAMQFLEDVDPATFNAYQRILSFNPDEQWSGSQEDDIRRGYETKAKELEDIGMNLQMKAYEEKLTNLKNKADSGASLTPQERQEYETLSSEYQTLATDKQNQAQRYPSVAAMDSDRLMQEALGSKNSIGKKFLLGVGENFDDAVNWVGDLMQNKGVAGDLELLGDKETSALNRYTSEKDRLVGSDFVAKFDNDLEQKIKEIKNSNLSDEQKQDKVRKIILDNQDKVQYVANDKSGKYNFTSKAVLNTVGDVASDLVSQIGIAALTGGGANVSKAKQLTSLFGTTFATAYNDYYNDAIKNNVAKPSEYAITHTAIEAASELINNDFEVAKKLAGKTGTLGKVLNKVTKEEWEAIAKKGVFSKFKDAAIATGKSALSNAVQETTEEVAGQLAGNIADQKVFNKESGIGEGVKDTMIQTMVGMLPLGLFSLPFNYQNINRNQKYAMYEAGMNPNKFIEAIDKGLAEGTITPKQAEEQKQNIQKAAQAVQSSVAIRTDGTPMTDNEKTEYAFNQSVLQEIREQKRNAPEEMKEELEKKEAEIDKEQTELVKPKKPKLTAEQKIINQAIKNGKLPDVIAEEAKKNPQEFFKMVADQVYGVNADGSQSLQPDAEKAVRGQFGDKIVDKAKEIFPQPTPSTSSIQEPPTQDDEGIGSTSEQQEIKIETPDDFDRELKKAIQNETETTKEQEPPTEAKTEGKKTKATSTKEAEVGQPIVFYHAGGKVKGTVVGNLSDGRIQVKDSQGTNYNVKPKNIIKGNETATEHYERTKGLPRLGEINQKNNKRPTAEDISQYNPETILSASKDFYKDDPQIARVSQFLEPLIKANPNIKIDTSFDWSNNEYEGQKITNQALGYSFPSGNVIVNFDRINDYDTLYRTALHELVHAVTRSEINNNTAFNSELKNVLAEVRKSMSIPDGDSLADTLIRNKVISEDYDNRYGAANEHELLAEVFTNDKFFNFLKGLEYKGDNMLHRLFLAIAKFFSENYKKIVGAKSNISADNLADYLMSLTESVISEQQNKEQNGDALALMRPKGREVLKNVITKALGKISDTDIREKLKQIAGLTDDEIDELMSEVNPVSPKPAPSRVLTPDEIGITPNPPKRKSALRKFKDKYFDRAQGMPDYILRLKDNAKGLVHLEVRQALQLVDRVKKTANQIGFDDWDLFDKALRGQYYGSDLSELKALPPEMQVLNVQMRNKIDGLSRDLIINNYVTPEQALNIESNIGEYMTRSYRAFNEKNWGKKVPQKAKDDAYRLLVQEIFNEKLNDKSEEIANGTITEDALIDEAKIEAFKELQSIIDGISDRYTPTKTNIQKGKDLGILKQRKDIPKEIRELLGEYTDPGVNFAMTIARIASLKSQSEYLSSLKDQGMGEIFFESEDRPAEASVQIASEGSETWNPLNGLYTTPEIKEIFKETENARNVLLKAWLTSMGAIRWGKTVGSVVTQVKNFESNIGFAVMNGHYRGGKSKESFKFLKDKLFKGEKSQDEMIEKVIRLGIVDQSIGVRELRDMLNSDNLDKVIANQSSITNSPIKKLSNKLGKPISYLNKIYAASDDFWKVYGFLNDAESLSQASYQKPYKELTDDEQSLIDAEASERVKNTYPTYDRIWEGTKFISKNLPIFGNFIAFTAESIRVLLNTFDYAIKDLKTPGRKSIGAQRLAGIAAYLGARTTILYFISQMTGVGMAGLLGMASDDDEDQKLKDINRYSPDFIRSGDKMALDHGDGNYTVYDVGGLEPYGIWFKTMNAYNEGNDIVKDGGLGASVTELLSTFVEPEMTFKTGVDIWKNENDFGSRIYNPTDDFGDQTLDAMGYVVKKLRPSTIDFIQRLYSKADKQNEIAAAFGGRGYKVESVKQFSFKLKAAEELFDANRDALNKIKYSPESTEEQIRDAQSKFEERTNKIVKMLAEDYQAAIRLGAKIDGLDEVLDRKKFFQGYNKNIKNQIKSGVVEEAAASDEIKEWQP